MKISKAPIISPYDLIQEHYLNDPWKIMICCMFLNMTTRSQVDKVVNQFFEYWPTAWKASLAQPKQMEEIISCLGLKEKRTASIIKMSKEWITKDWKNPIELHGLGQYAQDCYDIFINRYIIDSTKDVALARYLEWMKNYF